VPSIFDIDVMKSDGQHYSLSRLKGKTMLIVNTASQCRFTPQYQELEILHKKYEQQGLVILAFPCNQFAKQEPETDDKIETFCQVNYGISFALHKKIQVNGRGTIPLYQFLKSRAKGVLGSESIKWNFTKFLVSPDGQTIQRFSPTTSPMTLESQIIEYLSNN